jgi:hypothetical protein
MIILSWEYTCWYSQSLSVWWTLKKRNGWWFMLPEVVCVRYAFIAARITVILGLELLLWAD